MRIDYRWSVGDAARLHKDAAELVALGPEVILAGVGPTTQALQQASRVTDSCSASTGLGFSV